MSIAPYVPTPIFGDRGTVIEQIKAIQNGESAESLINQWLNTCFAHAKITLPDFANTDYQAALQFLHTYRGSTDTFTAYRRDIERLLQWSWFVKKQSCRIHTRDDMEAFIEFCQKPPKRWISLKNVARFTRQNSEMKPNPVWRPFTASVSKKEHQEGQEPQKDTYRYSHAALKILFGILSSFYSYLIQEQAIGMNPMVLMRQKSKFLQKETKTAQIRRLSQRQWETVIMLVKKQAEHDLSAERTLFILSCLYGMYLRISELVADARWTPTMGDFFKDADENWWFKTLSKGNKARQIAVSDAMLAALQRYRETYLKLSPFPSLNERTPLIAHNTLKSTLSITSDRPIRMLVQHCFDQAADYLEKQGYLDEASNLRIATVHWLRHTGISEDVKHRPREHVRDDAGHSSGAITDHYIDVELKERAKSAKNKTIDSL